MVNQIINQYGPALVSFAVTVAIFLVTFFVVYAIARIALVRLTKGALRSRGFGQEVRGLAGSVMAAIALFVALGVAATVAGFGVVLGAFATLLGALSLAVGFAMQDLLSNFVAGVFILRDEPFQIGDWTEWYGDTERTGVVRDIQLRVTKIETFDNELITVPQFRTRRQRRQEPRCERGTTRAVHVRHRLRGRHRSGQGHHHPGSLDGRSVQRERFGRDRHRTRDSAVGLTARRYITDPDRSKYVNAQSNWVEAVKNRFDAEGIDMPYPYTELTGTLDVADAQREEAASADD